MLILSAKALSISTLSSIVGIWQHSDLSNLPGRSSAGSIRSGLLVAAITYTPTTEKYKGISFADQRLTLSRQNDDATQKGMLLFKVAFSLFSIINQSACSTLDWVLNVQPYFDWMLYWYRWVNSNTAEDNFNANISYCRAKRVCMSNNEKHSFRKLSSVHMKWI